MLMRLKRTEIREYRLRQLDLQSNVCALCGDLIEDDAVLDHDHKTGLLRQVLHRGCNSLLGKIENNLPRSRMTIGRLEVFANRLIEYITTEHTKIIHPTYKIKENTMPGRGKGRGKGRKPPKR